MKANYRRPRELEDMSASSMRRINEYYTEKLEEEIRERKDIQKQYDDIEKTFLRYVMIVLHEGFGFGQKRCMAFLVAWKRIGRRMLKMQTQKEQAAWMDERMGWFPNYPDAWVNAMIENSKGETK